MVPVSFFREGNDDVALITEYLAVVPRVNDLISYSFEINDREKWNADSLAAGDIAGALIDRWRVVQVQHLIRRVSSIGQPSQVVCVFLEPKI